MELKAFVSETLRQVIDGVKDAQSAEDGDLVNARFGTRSDLPGSIINALDNGLVTIVEFDVLVSAESKGGAKGGLKVFSIGVEGGGEIANSSANRIKFAIPLRLPEGRERIRTGSNPRVIRNRGVK